jgi:hypothetical protein
LVSLVEGLSIEAVLYPERALPARQEKVLESFLTQVSAEGRRSAEEPP